MVSFCLGCAAFLLYFFYDINSISRQSRLPHTFFALGTLLLAGAVMLDTVRAVSVCAFQGIPDIFLLAACFICLLLLIYTLFFALPFEETYTKQTDGRCVYDKGVYALCRHPGILFFFLMYLLLGLAALPMEGLLIRGMIFSLLNLAYAYFQDRITFPKTFCDYKRYQQDTPFLIPTKASFRLACRTLRCRGEKEVGA